LNSNKYGNAYESGFSAGCQSVEGNTNDSCELTIEGHEVYCRDRPDDPQNVAQRNSTEASNTTSVIGQGSPQDFPEGPSGFPSKAVNIAMELTRLNSVELADYPITDLNTDEITSVFNLLNPLNLAKVLLSINQEDLIKIQNMMPTSMFEEILGRLLMENKSQVQDRLSSHLASVENLG
jgi:hypothetical protein